MNIKRIAVVVNPSGGRRNGIRVLHSIQNLFSAAGIQLDVHVTLRVGHATELTRALDLTGIQGICVVGGDGTIHEVANGLMQRAEAISMPLGIIPAGTGNAVAEHFEFHNPIEAAKRIIGGQTQRLDVVEVTLEDRKVFCVNIVGWGAASDINCTAERIRFLGPTRYTLAALLHIAAPRVRRATLVLDGKSVTDDFLFVMACNTKFTGAGMKLAPHAEIGDGKVDVAVIRRISRSQMLSLFRRVFDGSHVSLPSMEFHRVTSFAIHAGVQDRMNLDGEIKGKGPFSAQVLPAALSVFV